MPTISLKAHFDGNSIQLDEPFELPRDAQLIITVLPLSSDREWANLSAQGLARAYGDNEPEYSVADTQP
jgi:hypothetical protein